VGILKAEASFSKMEAEGSNSSASMASREADGKPALDASAATDCPRETRHA